MEKLTKEELYSLLNEEGWRVLPSHEAAFGYCQAFPGIKLMVLHPSDFAEYDKLYGRKYRERKKEEK